MHRALVASLPARSTPPSLVALDGSYDFQTNRAEMGEKIAVFFRSKVGVPTTVVGLPETERPGADLAPTAFSATLAALDAANILFLGPGSPSRALFRWAGTPIVDRLVSRIHAGATLITSSAAAAASGESAIPVYEIYKAGLPAHWLTGLNLVGTLLGNLTLFWVIGRIAQNQEKEKLREIQRLQQGYLEMAQRESARMKKYAEMEG